MIEREVILQTIREKLYGPIPDSSYPYEEDQIVMGSIQDIRAVIELTQPLLLEEPLIAIESTMQDLSLSKENPRSNHFIIMLINILVLIEEAEKQRYSELEIYNALRCV